jgi:hypothetical protein
MLGIFISLPARVLLGYELGVIRFFSQLSFGVSVESVSVFVVGIYYLLIAWFLYAAWRKSVARSV